MVAHPSQLHAVPDDMSDEAAVMVEPTACAVHAALRRPIREGDTVVVLGAGTLGLLTIAALRHLTPAGVIITSARYPAPDAAGARSSAPTRSASPASCPASSAASPARLAYRDQLTGGCDVVLDCVGDSDSLAQALAIVRPRGTVVVVGMPAQVKLELTTLWHRETELVGAYAYGLERSLDGDEPRRTFDARLRPRPPGRPRPPRDDHLPAAGLQGRHRPRRLRRPAGRREGRVRPPTRRRSGTD